MALHQKTQAGPASYATGGFTVSFGEFGLVKSAQVGCDNGTYLAKVASVSGSDVTVTAYTALGTEVTATTDLSAVTFTVTADGQ